MAYFHMKLDCTSHGDGHSSVEGVAYITRSVMKDLRTGETWDFRNAHRYEQLIATGTELPDDAPEEWSDPKVLWNAAEAFNDTKAGRTARRIEFALPNTLSDDECIEVIKKVVRRFTKRGMCVTWAFHDNVDGHHNKHAHLNLTVNPCNKDGFTKKGKTGYVVHDKDGNELILTSDDLNEHKDEYFKLYRYVNTSDGEVQWMTDAEATQADGEWERVNKYPKKRKLSAVDWDSGENCKIWRKMIEVEINEALKANGCRERVSCESYEKLGVDRIPTIHEGAAVRRAEADAKAKAKENGVPYEPVTERRAYNLKVKAANHRLAQMRWLCYRRQRILQRKSERLKREAMRTLGRELRHKVNEWSYEADQIGMEII